MTPHTRLGTIGHLARLGLTNALAYFSSSFIVEDTKYYSFDTRLMLQQTLRMFGLKIKKCILKKEFQNIFRKIYKFGTYLRFFHT